MLRSLLPAALTLPLLAGCVTPVPPPSAADTVAVSARMLTGWWDLEQVGRQRTEMAIWLSFDGEGNARGAIACNRWSGPYRLTGGMIEYGENIIITSGGCHPRFATRELTGRAEETLWRHDAAYLSGDGDYLYLDGQDRLVFRRTTEAAILQTDRQTRNAP